MFIDHVKLDNLQAFYHAIS